MKSTKRAFISIMRRKTSSLILLGIVFLLANVLMTTLTVSQSLKKTKTYVLQQFLPTVSIVYDSENYDENAPEMRAEMADEVYSLTSDIVDSYDYSLNTTISRGNMNLYNVSQAHPELIESNTGISLYGTQLSYTNLVAQKGASLLEGSGFSEQDIQDGNAKAIVSKQFAEVNGISVGTYITLGYELRELVSEDPNAYSTGDVYYSAQMEVEVVGILQIEEVETYIQQESVATSDNYTEISMINMQANAIYCPNNYVKSIKDEMLLQQQQHMTPEGFEEFIGSTEQSVIPTYNLKTIDDLDVFCEKAYEVYDSHYFTVDSTMDEYEVVAKPLESMESLLDTVFVITVSASIAIMVLILYIFIYLRQKELGIYLALGERRGNIFWQLVVETLVVAIIGATLAVFTSTIFSDMLMNNTIHALLSTTSQESMYSMTTVNSGMSAQWISEQFQSGFGIETLFVFYGTMVITILISQFAALLYLLRLNPKKILM